MHCNYTNFCSHNAVGLAKKRSHWTTQSIWKYHEITFPPKRSQMGKADSKAGEIKRKRKQKSEWKHKQDL